ncbi:universal stress protein [Actinospica sp. MGRD01-02]|uniref:Universal stress protein n=1 Tax=Actinospica acidithermotolerans TaxID=2828514 RepID=A0A941E3Q3_9ACTN|nr:universal stress protein [Actinospica acidithermotolerans]MBR7825635.1 universal stress protein [Actinospica acidithermotolerans]
MEKPEQDNSKHPRVVVSVDQSLSGYAALRVAAGEARSRNVPLQAVRAMPGIGIVDMEYVDAAFEEALGGYPAGVEVTRIVAFDSTSGALARHASDPRDLIVVGNDGRGRLRAAWFGSVARSLLKHARCQVLVVPPPEMQRATRRSLRKLRRHRADVWDRFETEVPQLRGRPFQGA